MALLAINEEKRSTDEEGRLTREYTVQDDGKETVETVKTAYLIQSNTRLPQLKEVNPKDCRESYYLIVL